MQQQDSSHPTGVSTVDPEDRGGSTLARARHRKANAALQLKKSGASWDEIAETLGFPTARAARVAVEQALEEQLKTPESREALREIIGQRYERLTRAFMKRAISEDSPEQYQAARMVRDFTGDFVKLMGLQAPTEYIVHNPTMAEIEAWVDKLTAQRAPEVVEADIFDIEVVEDEVRALPAQ